MFLTYPTGLAWEDWASQMVLDVTSDVLPVPPPIEEWREWADFFARSVPASNTSVPFVAFPDETQYPTWEAWATDAVRLINDSSQV